MNSTCEPTGQQHLGCVRDAPLPHYTHSAARLTFREQANAWLRAVCYTLVYPSIEPLHVTDNTSRGPSQHSWPVGSCISDGCSCGCTGTKAVGSRLASPCQQDNSFITRSASSLSTLLVLAPGVPHPHLPSRPASHLLVCYAAALEHDAATHQRHGEHEHGEYRSNSHPAGSQPGAQEQGSPNLAQCY